MKIPHKNKYKNGKICAWCRKKWEQPGGYAKEGEGIKRNSKKTLAFYGFLSVYFVLQFSN